ncbi:phospholipid methyltransferase [Calocera viscosa TUFC12733]|uniref:Phosphatidyl-N-methylethanolamine N-methyltransferase n=1 Tax=Calocera viscosa (strain TUFC12733) TaxID=1330018 RepID=A0A167N9R9_CALVF|nr:phospholipid methyltransferase [Calocera viscosa TUFC12733]
MVDTELSNLIDLSQPSLYVAVGAIVFNPTFWNIAAQNEYHHRTITKFFGGNRIYGCYALAVAIFVLGLIRDTLYTRALQEQPKMDLLTLPIFQSLAAFMFAVGQILVLTSTYALGITGTYLGDYFGILMKERVESFPYTMLRDPMYVGSTMCFFAGAFWYARPAGILLSILVWLVYMIALRFEGPFTDRIYSERETMKKRG